MKELTQKSSDTEENENGNWNRKCKWTVTDMTLKNVISAGLLKQKDCIIRCPVQSCFYLKAVLPTRHV